MTKNDLEGKTQAPTVVFADDVIFSGAGSRQVRLDLAKEEGVPSRYCNFGYGAVEAVYDNQAKPQWQNQNVRNHRKVDLPENLRGTQVVFSDTVVYEGAHLGGHHFSFLENGRYVGHDHQRDLAKDFRYSWVKAIFDKSGKIIWENYACKKKQ